MIKSETIGQLAKALSLAQGQMKAAAKDSDNPFFKSKYADLSSVWEAARQPLTDNGLSVVQTLDNQDNAVVIETMLLHESGEFIGGRVAVTPAKADAQGYGSVISYMRRYSLSALIGGYADDNDAETDREAHDKRQGKKEEKKKDESKTFMTCDELITRMAECKAKPELDNVLKKYKPDYDKMTAEEQKSVKSAKEYNIARLDRSADVDPFEPIPEE